MWYSNNILKHIKKIFLLPLFSTSSVHFFTINGTLSGSIDACLLKSVPKAYNAIYILI